MSYKGKVKFTKDNIDTYLKAVAKKYRKQVGKQMPAEIILIGGASVLINYGFREMTTDIDALIQAASAMEDAINAVGDEFDLPNGWMNQDFVRTKSYSPNLIQYSTYYKTYSNILTIRTIAAEYLIAMKLRSGRNYKNDLLDILGILNEHQINGDPITLERIQKAVCDLYGEWEAIPDGSRTFIMDSLAEGHFQEQFNKVNVEEKKTRELLINFDKDYPDVINQSNTSSILKNLRKKK